MQKRYLFIGCFWDSSLPWVPVKREKMISSTPLTIPLLQPPEAEEVVVNLDPNSIDGLHHFVFKPTCFELWLS